MNMFKIVSRFKKLAAVALIAGAATAGFAGSAEAGQRCSWVGGGPYDRSGYRCVDVRGPSYGPGHGHHNGWDRHDRGYYPPVVYHRPPPPVVYYRPAPRVVYTQPYYAPPRGTTIIYYNR
jgi:hypothetical protein